MKIAICDFRFHKGHSTFNSAVLSAVHDICGDNFIYFDNGNNYRNSENFSAQRRLVKNKNDDANSPLKNRFASRYYMNSEYKILKKEECDKVICIAFDLITFGLCGKKYWNKDLYLWHHAESDELTNRFKRKIFIRYMNKVKHIVHTSFIKDYLVKMGVEEKRIFVCPFIKTSVLPVGDKPVGYKEEKNFFIAPSGSNDEKFCVELVKFEQETQFFLKNEIKLFIKSFDTVFDDGYLTLYNRYLSFEEYDALYERAAAVVVPFPTTFQMRESGTIIDALSAGKRIISIDIPIARHYKDICASVDENAVSTFSDINDFCEELLKKTEVKKSEIAVLVGGLHSSDSMLIALSNALNNQ